MRKRICMNASQRTQMIYLPARVPLVGTRESSVRKLSIALQEMPEHISGQALRIGYAGDLLTDLALYRLKLKATPGHAAITLFGFFVLEHGLFRVYEE